MGKKISARDNGRTPFQWDDSKNAGFTNGTPWLKVNPNYKKLNAASQEKDPNSTLNYFRKMVKLRKALPELVYGKYELIDKDNEKIYAYTRTLNGKKVLVLLNFSTSKSKFEIPKKAVSLNVLMNNVASLSVKNNTVTMEPYQALIIRLQ